MSKRALVVALVLLLVQGSTPLVLCLLQERRAAFLCGTGFYADSLDAGGYCGNYLAMFWTLAQATAYASVLAAEAGATVFLVGQARSLFGETWRGFLAAVSAPLLLGALVVPNFFFATCLIETRSYTVALAGLRDFFSGYSELGPNLWLLPLHHLVPVSARYAVFLEIVVVSEWRRLPPLAVLASCVVWAGAARWLEGPNVGLAAWFASAAWLLTVMTWPVPRGHARRPGTGCADSPTASTPGRTTRDATTSS